MKNFPKEKPLRSKSKSGGGGVACDEEACCAVPATGTGWVRPTHPVCGFSTGPTFFPSLLSQVLLTPLLAVPLASVLMQSQGVLREPMPRTIIVDVLCANGRAMPECISL